MSKMTWLVTGCAGFIGSHLTQRLLRNGHRVVGIDNYRTGPHANLIDIRNSVAHDQWNFQFFEGDIRDYTCCARAMPGVDVVVNLAAEVSVPASMNDPLTTHHVNTGGFCNILTAAGASGVKKVVYASSCAVYGGQGGKLREDTVLLPKSPYAGSKMMNEVQGRTFTAAYGLPTVGLRFFNVFGTRQDPNGSYAAVIPRWLTAMIEDKPVEIFGDGTQTRDFVCVKDVVNSIMAVSFAPDADVSGTVFNVGTGREKSLLELFTMLSKVTGYSKPPQFLPARQGDVLRACADVGYISHSLGFKAQHPLHKELPELCQWYQKALET
jgi:UDP-N-acetylglucosamine 4-epimerase